MESSDAATRATCEEIALGGERPAIPSCWTVRFRSVRGLRRPAVRQQFFDPAGRLGWQPIKHVLEAAMRIVAVELRRLDQAHRRRGALPATQRSSEQPVRAPECDRSDPVHDPVVVDGHSPVLEEAHQRHPSIQTVVMVLAIAVPSLARCRCSTSHCRNVSVTGLDRSCRNR